MTITSSTYLPRDAHQPRGAPALVCDLRHRPAPSPGLCHHHESAAGNPRGRHQLHQLRQLARGGHDCGVSRNHPGADREQRRRRAPGGRLPPLPGADVRSGPRAAKSAPGGFHSRRELRIFWANISGRVFSGAGAGSRWKYPARDRQHPPGSVSNKVLGAHRFQPQHCHHRTLRGPQSPTRAYGHGSVPAGTRGCPGERSRPGQPRLHRQQLRGCTLGPSGRYPGPGPHRRTFHRPQPVSLGPT